MKAIYKKYQNAGHEGGGRGIRRRPLKTLGKNREAKQNRRKPR